MVKYPKTPRLAAVLESELALWRRSTAIVEEKVDGANAAIHFSGDGLVLQSRGHVLCGGLGEAQFDLLKSWCVYRPIAIAQNGASRSPIPRHGDHRFRRNAITRSA